MPAWLLPLKKNFVVCLVGVSSKYPLDYFSVCHQMVGFPTSVPETERERESVNSGPGVILSATVGEGLVMLS